MTITLIFPSSVIKYHETQKEVDWLIRNIKRLESEPALAEEIEKLSEIVTPAEEDIRKI